MPITSNVGGVLHELDVVNSNVGGVLKEIHSGIKSRIRFDPSVWVRDNFSDDTQFAYSFYNHQIHLSYSGRYTPTSHENSSDLLRIYILKVNPGDVVSISFSHTRSDDHLYYIAAVIYQVIDNSVKQLALYSMGNSSGNRTVSVTSESDNNIYITPQCNYSTAVTWNLYINSITINGNKLF